VTDDRTPDTRIAEVAKRLAVLRRHLDDEVPLARAAADTGVFVRTARRWLTRYRAAGPARLGRPRRPEAGTRKFAQELVELIEGMALLKPPLSVATIHRRAGAVAIGKGWRAASYGSVRDIVRQLNPALLTLAHEGRSRSGTGSIWYIGIGPNDQTRRGRPTTPNWIS